MARVFNFSAGPAMLPQPVMTQIEAELQDWQGLGLSVMELSHRSDPYMAMAQEVEANLRDLMQIPNHYQVLFLPGGGRGQFAAVPMNLMSDYTVADYLDTGYWSGLAETEARRFCNVNQVASSQSSGYTSIPDQSKWQLSEAPAYCHIVSNETIDGLEFPTLPSLGDIPLVVDMSSNILSRRVDVSQAAVIYAGAQKNMGPSGITVVIIREDLLSRSPTAMPSILNYRLQSQSQSLLNTPNTFTWYVVGLVLKWLQAQGGLEKQAATNARKADALYSAIDQSDLYFNRVEPLYRSRMNVVFRLADEGLNDEFLRQATATGLANLQGHSAVGGMRASIYNAMPEAGVRTLIEFMREFERKMG